MEELSDFVRDANGKVIRYHDNTNLRPAHCPLELSKEHVAEFTRCKNDVFYFAEHYYKIVELDYGLRNIRLRNYQKEIMEKIDAFRFNILNMPRQSGKSTIFQTWLTHYILFNSHKSVAILANKRDNAQDMLKKVKLAYENLPKWMQQGVTEWNLGRIELENGSIVYASSTASSSIRSKSINILILDEVAFIHENMWDAFYSSTYPAITASKTSKVIMVSTPNGINQFFQLWEKAVACESEYIPTRIYWWDTPGRDEDFKEEIIANFGIEKWRQEYECNFYTTSNTLLQPDKIKELAKFAKPGIKSKLHKAFEKIQKGFEEHLRVFQNPKSHHEYAIGVDSAKMTPDSKGDAICVQVLDVTKLPFKQVATFYVSEGFYYMNTPELVDMLGRFYNNALVYVENNDGSGSEIAGVLFLDYEYENLYFGKLHIPGYKQTSQTKKLGIQNLRTYVEKNKLHIYDIVTISQFSYFVKYRDTYKAQKDYHDDAILALIHALYFLQLSEYVDSKADLIDAVMKDDKYLMNKKLVSTDGAMAPSDMFGGESDDRPGLFDEYDDYDVPSAGFLDDELVDDGGWMTR